MTSFKCEIDSGGNRLLKIDETVCLPKEDRNAYSQVGELDCFNRGTKNSYYRDILTDSHETEHSSQYSFTNTCKLKNEEEPSSTQFNVIMDVKEPLFMLRSILQEEFDHSLNDIRIFLQDGDPLDENKSLIDQCLKYDGIVQVLCEIKLSLSFEHIINIIDVALPAVENEETTKSTGEFEVLVDVGKERWVIDRKFGRYLEELGIPLDPTKWHTNAFRHWLMWAIFRFKLNIDFSKWVLNGMEVLNINCGKFEDGVSNDPFGHFWTHCQLFSKHRFICFNEIPIKQENIPHLCQDEKVEFNFNKVIENTHDVSSLRKTYETTVTESNDMPDYYEDVLELNDLKSSVSYKPTTLWQFLLEMLTERHFKNAIKWLDCEGEFIILDPQLVAHLWGLKKNKPNMDYKKLSRSLRYYYGDLLCKVPGKRFVYKFVCNLQQLIGYSANELSALVSQATANNKLNKTL